MRVAVTVASDVRDRLVRLLLDRTRSQDDALGLAIAYLEEVRRVFEEHGGPPPGAILRPRGPGGSWWLYADGIWLAFTRADRYEGFRPFGELVRTFTVVGAARPAAS
jgi:hypothetical protein